MWPRRSRLLYPHAERFFDFFNLRNFGRKLLEHRLQCPISPTVFNFETEPIRKFLDDVRPFVLELGSQLDLKPLITFSNDDMHGAVTALRSSRAIDDLRSREQARQRYPILLLVDNIRNHDTAAHKILNLS